MINIMLTLIGAILTLIKVPLVFLLGAVAVFYLLVALHVLYGYIKGKKIKKGRHKKVKKSGLIKRLFFDLPKQYAQDVFDQEPDFFKYQGCIIYCGRQGNGKTITMIHDAMQMQEEYPLAKCMTNLGYSYEDFPLKHWKQLVKYKNGKHGVIAVMDELQNWFSSNQSKSFPPEMLQVITQNRKNRRVILGTAQNFYLLAKAIRSQATQVRDCYTFLGCLTIVRKKEPILDSEGNVKEWKHRGMYFYVHDKKLRESYDTYKVIESLAKSGFQEKTELNISVKNVAP